jgi:hypothetical protein
MFSTLTQSRSIYKLLWMPSKNDHPNIEYYRSLYSRNMFHPMNIFSYLCNLLLIRNSQLVYIVNSLPLFDFSKSYFSFKVVLLILKYHCFDSLRTQGTHEDSWVHLFIEWGINFLSICKFINFMSLIDQRHRVQPSQSWKVIATIILVTIIGTNS